MNDSWIHWFTPRLGVPEYDPSSLDKYFALVYWGGVAMTSLLALSELLRRDDRVSSVFACVARRLALMYFGASCVLISVIFVRVFTYVVDSDALAPEHFARCRTHVLRHSGRILFSWGLSGIAVALSGLVGLAIRGRHRLWK
jgi:hypothetical protein